MPLPIPMYRAKRSSIKSSEGMPRLTESWRRYGDAEPLMIYVLHVGHILYIVMLSRSLSYTGF